LADGEFLDLFNIEICLRKRFTCTQCFYDENFNRLVLKLDEISATVFANGKVMVYGVITEKDIEEILIDLWLLFFRENIRKYKPK